MWRRLSYTYSLMCWVLALPLRQAGCPLGVCKGMSLGIGVIPISLLSEEGSEVHPVLLRGRVPTLVTSVFEGRREPETLSASVCRCSMQDLVYMGTANSFNDLWGRRYYPHFCNEEPDAQWGSVIYMFNPIQSIRTMIHVDYKRKRNSWESVVYQSVHTL